MLSPCPVNTLIYTSHCINISCFMTNIVRFISSTAAGAVLRFFLNSLTLLMAITGPVSVIVFFMLIKLDLFQSLFELDTEFWFGVEVGVYIILPLLLLTIFGTVNCCKVSMSSRMLPTNQVQAIKINIGLTVTTNLTLFLFLVQVKQISEIDQELQYCACRSVYVCGTSS